MKKFLNLFKYIIIIMILVIIIDLTFIFIFDRPLLAIKTNNDSANIYYKGLFYDLYNCNDDKKIKLKGTKYNCSIDRVIEILDSTLEINDFSCLQMLEEFYEDDDYTYYWSCIKGSYMIVKYESGIEDTISNALKNKSITIKDLDDYNIKYIKERK